MKKLWRALGTIALGMVFLAGCGNGQRDTKGSGQTVGSVVMDAEGQGQSSERVALTLGTVGRSHDGMLKAAVEAYNAQGGNYYVEIVDYLPENYDNAIMEASANRFKMNLATGKGTDIVDLYSLEADELGYRGILADLNKYMTWLT